MAPSSNSAKSLQQNRVRPAVPKMVVPAIPLPYVQKRQKQQEAAALARSREEAVPSPAPTTEPVEETSSSTPSITENKPPVVNGSSADPSEKAEEADEPEVPGTIADPAVEGVQIPAEKPQELVTQIDTIDLKTGPPSGPSEGHSSASRSTYQMPPPFIPANTPQTQANNGDSSKVPPPVSFNGQYPMHHAHPSTSSLMFGAYPESSNSSPAPPPSTGNVPPYPPYPNMYPQHGIRHHGAQPSNGSIPQQTSSGYSPMGPPPSYYQRQDGYANQGPGTELPRRQVMSGGHSSFNFPEGVTSSSSPPGLDGRLHDPSTPLSVQGSHSSAPVEQESGPAFYSQYPTAVVSNGANGHIEEVRLYQQPRPKARNGSQAIGNAPAFPTHPAHQPPLPMDHLDGLVNYLQSQFADPSLADFTLELRYSDDRAPPVRIPGHNLMFARSPTLKTLMAHQAHSDGLTVRTLLIESDDHFLRSDGFWMAVQRLYGGPLLDLGVLAGMNPSTVTQATNSMPGTSTDRFHLALGYAAAGQILQIPPVINRGVEIASHFLSWTTIEKALDFALDGGLDAQWTLQNGQVQDHTPSTYGPAVNMLIHSAMNFVITSFPAGFRLDTSVEDPSRNPRLPVVQEDRFSGLNPRLSFIKFGDHASEDDVPSSSSNPLATTLSKILINLPFHLLKYVLESSRLGNVQGWATTVLRQEVMHAVVGEREKRRIKVHSSPVSNQDRRYQLAVWDVVGWQETVELLGGNEATPTLNRTWNDFTVLET